VDLMMNRSPQTSNIHPIVCQDHLWNALSEESRDSGVSVDYLVNEAIRYYLNSHTSRVVNTETSPLGFFKDSGLDQQAKRTLYLWFGNQRYVIQKDFIIGRHSSNLVIVDESISKNHCSVILQNGEFFMKDLDSRNGVVFMGQKIMNMKRIDEGDVFMVCKHQLKFTYLDTQLL
jgi:pSer/pThr/pTyr-binding forkhead associated (FHA) protein